MIEGFFDVLSKVNSTGVGSAVEVAIPPYPNIPHLFALQRNEAETTIRFILISFLNSLTQKPML